MPSPRIARPRDLRPSITDPAIMQTAVRQNFEAIWAWVQKRSYPEDEETVVVIIAEALAESGRNPKRAVLLLETVYFWDADDNLLKHIQAVNKQMTPVFRAAVLEWILRTGTRFRGKPGDLIDFIDDGTHYTGRVLEVKRDLAAGIVDTEAKSNRIVLAEQITCNRTTGYSIQKLEAPK